MNTRNIMESFVFRRIEPIRIRKLTVNSNGDYFSDFEVCLPVLNFIFIVSNLLTCQNQIKVLEAFEYHRKFSNLLEPIFKNDLIFFIFMEK